MDRGAAGPVLRNPRCVIYDEPAMQQQPRQVENIEHLIIKSSRSAYKAAGSKVISWRGLTVPRVNIDHRNHFIHQQSRCHLSQLYNNNAGVRRSI